MNVTRLYPVSLEEVPQWAKENAATQDEARRRFVQFVIIESLARGLPGKLSFKGGNALRFCYHNPRSTTDIDYTAGAEFGDDPDGVRSQLDPPLQQFSQEYGIACRVQAVHRNPSSAAATKPTYEISVGWSFPGFRNFPGFLESEAPSSAIIPVEISINDIVCETIIDELEGGRHVGIEVCALEDIVAEKLRALLQQIARNRNRPQDVYDISRLLRVNSLDEAKVARYFVAKCQDRGVLAAKSSFVDEVRERASVDYEQLASSTMDDFVPFGEAWGQVAEFVSRLDIPA
jgi:predicted nucleotidyltransferase component of viral defense system